MDRSFAMRLKTPWYWAACVAAFVPAGCAQHDKTAPPPATQPVMLVPSPVDEFIEVQTANGAASDATLYRGHFSGDQLNTLGRSKLALLARNHEAGQHVTVYVDLPDNAEVAPARRDAIASYLAHAGVASGDLEVKSGPNPDNYYSAAAAIEGLQKTDSDYKSQQSEQPMSSSHGGGSSGYGGGTSPAGK